VGVVGVAGEVVSLGSLGSLGGCRWSEGRVPLFFKLQGSICGPWPGAVRFGTGYHLFGLSASSSSPRSSPLLALLALTISRCTSRSNSPKCDLSRTSPNSSPPRVG
jgi:hypothetical protein